MYQTYSSAKQNTFRTKPQASTQKPIPNVPLPYLPTHASSIPPTPMPHHVTGGSEMSFPRNNPNNPVQPTPLPYTPFIQPAHQRPSIGAPHVVGGMSPDYPLYQHGHMQPNVPQAQPNPLAELQRRYAELRALGY